MKIIDEFCPLMNRSCRHVSIHFKYKPFTRISKDERTGLFMPAGIGNKRTEIGEYCNDFGEYISEMHYCPVEYDKKKKGAGYKIKKKGMK